MFDEPSSYLDVKQRLKCALTIRSLLGDDRYDIEGGHCPSLTCLLHTVKPVIYV